MEVMPLLNGTVLLRIKRPGFIFGVGVEATIEDAIILAQQIVDAADRAAEHIGGKKNAS